MAYAHSLDLRRRVVRAVEAGASCRRAAARFEVGVSSAIRWVAQSRRTGDVAPKPRGGPRRPSRIDPHGALIMDWVAAEPDLTLAEIAAKLEAAVGYRPPTSVVHEFFQRRGVTRKKRRRTPPNRAGRMSRSGGAPGSTPSPTSTPSA